MKLIRVSNKSERGSEKSNLFKDLEIVNTLLIFFCAEWIAPILWKDFWYQLCLNNLIQHFVRYSVSFLSIISKNEEVVQLLFILGPGFWDVNARILIDHLYLYGVCP